MTKEDTSSRYILVLFKGDFDDTGSIYYTEENVFGFYTVKKL